MRYQCYTERRVRLPCDEGERGEYVSEKGENEKNPKA